MNKKSPYIKLFSYGTLCDKDVQKREFGQEFIMDKDLDYLSGYNIQDIKINKNTYKILIEGDRSSVIMGAIIYIPKCMIDLVDKYEGENYKRITVETMTGNNCELYIKR